MLRYCLLTNLQDLLAKETSTLIHSEPVGRIIEAVSPLGLAMLVVSVP